MESRRLTSQTNSLLQSTDWSATPLGAMDAWPRSLLGYVSMIMAMPSPAIIFWGEEQTQIYNDGYAVIMGPRHPRFFGASYRDCWPDTYPLIYPSMRRVLDHGEVVEVEKEHIPVTRYGFEEEAYFTFTFSPLRDDHGEIGGILQPVFEVTDTVLSRRRAETLRRMSPDHVSTDAVTHALAAFGGNPRDIPFARIYLWDAARETLVLAGSTAQTQADDGRDERLREVARQAFDANRIVKADELHALLLPIDGPSPSLPLGVLQVGIGPRLQFDHRYQQFLQMLPKQLSANLQRASTLHALERQRAYLNELFMQAPAGIAVLEGPDLVFGLVNPMYCELISSRDVLGQPLRAVVPDLEGHLFPDILEKVYRTGVPHVGKEVRAMLRRDASGTQQEAFLNFVYQPLHDALGRTSGILVFTYEVTEQVSSRRSAEGMAEALRAEHRRKDEFLAMLAHELRNPLAPITSAASVLLKAPSNEVLVRQASEILARQVRHMTALVNDLLDVSRVTRGLVTIAEAPEDLKIVVIEAIEQVRPVIEARGHRLVMHMAPETAHVSGDKKRLVQILTNLLNNAAKYTPPSGEIVIRMTVEEDEIVVAVKDNGVGIAQDLLARVFDLFVQAETSSDRTSGGLGIGLALVKSLTELHRGSISCTSEGPGKGAEFEMRLPRLQDGHGADEAAEDRIAASAGPRRRVLIVDDNEDAAKMLGMQLEAAGHAVMIEHSPLRALERARRDPPDVCVLDIGLPEMDGNELARRLRAAPETADKLLIALSGYGQDADKAGSMQAGFDHYVVKPLDAPALASLLRMRRSDGA